MLKSHAKIIVLFSILFAAIALVTTITGTLIYLDKKKDERDLERYLDEAIL